ncbi:MAG: hypothetical protein MI740_02370 [Halanaerobiales bacterium]|nr:hypothetical protein [Halanaerobiales bacterium]
MIKKGLNVPIVILDEPTAALDPYAEYQIYAQFNQLVGTNAAMWHTQAHYYTQ